MKLSLAYSSCPNDTFVFHAMTHGLVNTHGFEFSPSTMDIDALNVSAMRGEFDIIKISYHAYLYLKNKYTLLDSGSALGYGCGPLLVSKSGDAIGPGASIAIPGELTTANMLLKLWMPEAKNTSVLRFDEIMPGVESGAFDAGLIIHEGRFVFENYGLRKIVDLGEWWERETGLPIPLGCIVMKNSHSDLSNAVSGIIKSSVEYAFKNRSASRDYVKSLAQEMDEAVMDEHINLYVNDFTLSLGERGRAAVKKLEEMAHCRGILKV